MDTHHRFPLFIFYYQSLSKYCVSLKEITFIYDLI